MNELQQVLLVFSIVVIAGLFILSKRKQHIDTPQKSDPAEEKNHNEAPSEEKRIEEKSLTLDKVKTVFRPKKSTITKDTELEEQNVVVPKAIDESAVSIIGADVAISIDSDNQEGHKKASVALNELGEAHIPVSETTHQRLQMPVEPEIQPANQSENQPENYYDQGQGVLFFGEEFDLPRPEDVAATEVEQKQHAELPMEDELPQTPSQIEKPQGKHHVLVVDDPGLNGELEGAVLPDHEKPSFGIPKDKSNQAPVVSSGTKKDREVFVLTVLSMSKEFSLVDVNQALLGIGLTYTESGIYAKKDNMGNEFIRIANLLEPGTFPSENLAQYSTPGVAMILELPTTVRAPAAMHDLIMIARKLSQRLQGRLYNQDRQLIKESDLQAMRESAIEYESAPIK